LGRWGYRGASTLASNCMDEPLLSFVMSNMLSLHPETAAFLIGFGAPSNSRPSTVRPMRGTRSCGCLLQEEFPSRAVVSANQLLLRPDPPCRWLRQQSHVIVLAACLARPCHPYLLRLTSTLRAGLGVYCLVWSPARGVGKLGQRDCDCVARQRPPLHCLPNSNRIPGNCQ
jgi:hypothetical protein